MKKESGSDAFKKFLPKSIPDRDTTKIFSEEEIKEIFSIIGINPISNSLFCDNDEYIVTFKKIATNEWIVNLKFK